MLRTSPDLFQAFELHIRKPSFVVGNDRRYTMRIFEQLGVPNDEYREIVEAHAALAPAMNLGAWTGPREEVSAEPLTGSETDAFPSELAARGTLAAALMRRAATHAGAPRWGFKILGDIVHAETYAAVFPNAVFILLVRDPRDHALSVMTLNAQRQARGQPPFYPDYASVARGWRETIGTGRRVLEGAGLDHVIVRYEDLATEPEATLAWLGERLGIDLAEATRFHEQEFVEGHTRRFGHHDNLRKPVNAASVGRWRDKMTDAEAQVFAEVAGEVMSLYGYER
jgi:hypothetical protein